MIFNVPPPLPKKKISGEKKARKKSRKKGRKYE